MDKHIHQDEFRLRILATNQCNKDCPFCLNDFQAKQPELFIPHMEAVDCIRAYGEFMRSKKEKSIITFSGGEPGIHPLLKYMLIHARHHCNVVKVVTNGEALRPDLVHFVDEWHVGVTEEDPRVLDFLQYTKNIMVQIVVLNDMRTTDLDRLVDYYYSHMVKIKLFTDFFSIDQKDLEEKIKWIQKQYGEEIDTRFTGKQINRGMACAGCEMRCVTLKALWVFPDGSSSTCPQSMCEEYNDDSWDETVEKAYNAHKYREN